MSIRHDDCLLQEAVYYAQLKDEAEDLLSAILKMNNAASRQGQTHPPLFFRCCCDSAAGSMACIGL